MGIRLLRWHMMEPLTKGCEETQESGRTSEQDGDAAGSTPALAGGVITGGCVCSLAIVGTFQAEAVNDADGRQGKPIGLRPNVEVKGTFGLLLTIVSSSPYGESRGWRVWMQHGGRLSR